MKMKPHKYAEVIKAWADGHTVQIRNPEHGAWNWEDCDPNNLYWGGTAEYRVKPQNVIRYAPVLQMRAKSIVVGNAVTSADCAKMQRGEHDDLKGILKIELDPDTGELVQAVMEK